jgi:hypothetical protein
MNHANRSLQAAPPGKAGDVQAGRGAMRGEGWLCAAETLSAESSDSPDCACAMGNRAQAWIAPGRYHEAAYASGKAWAALSRSGQFVQPRSFVPFMRNRVEMRLQRGEPPAALETLDLAYEAAGEFAAGYARLMRSIRLRQTHAMGVHAQTHVHPGSNVLAVELFWRAEDKYTTLSDNTERLPELLTDCAWPLMETDRTTARARACAVLWAALIKAVTISISVCGNKWWRHH